MTEITDSVESIVEDSDLPRRLKQRVYETVQVRENLTDEQVEDIVYGVE